MLILTIVIRYERGMLIILEVRFFLYVTGHQELSGNEDVLRNTVGVDNYNDDNILEGVEDAMIS